MEQRPPTCSTFKLHKPYQQGVQQLGVTQAILILDVTIETERTLRANGTPSSVHMLFKLFSIRFSQHACSQNKYSKNICYWWIYHKRTSVSAPQSIPTTDAYLGFAHVRQRLLCVLRRGNSMAGRGQTKRSKNTISISLQSITPSHGVVCLIQTRNTLPSCNYHFKYKHIVYIKHVHYL